MKFSASKFKKFDLCALQAKFNYIDHIDRYVVSSAAHFGTSVHLALENFHNGCTIDEAVEIFRNYFDSVEIERWNRRQTYTGLKDLGPKMIREYAEAVEWESQITLGTEYRFMVPFGDHVLSGIVDHMHTNPIGNVLYLDDLKTGARPNLDNLHVDIQMTSYLWAAQQREFWVGMESDDPDWPDKYAGLPNGEELYEKFLKVKHVARWVDLKKTAFVDVGPRTDFDYARLYRMAEMIERAIQTDTYIPSITGEACTFCDYKDLCPVYLAPPDEVL